MTWQLVIYAYLIISSIITTGCFIAYFWVFWLYGIDVRNLIWYENVGCWNVSGGCWQDQHSYATLNEKINLHAPNHEPGECPNATDNYPYYFKSNNHCFDAIEQDTIQREACVAFYLSIVMGQVTVVFEDILKHTILFTHFFFRRTFLADYAAVNFCIQQTKFFTCRLKIIILSLIPRELRISKQYNNVSVLNMKLICL